MPGFPKFAADMDKSGVDFLLIELDAALTFLDVADTSRIDETVDRNHRNARKAYDTVLRLREKVRPNPEQQQLITEKLLRLRERLEAAGEQI